MNYPDGPDPAGLCEWSSERAVLSTAIVRPEPEILDELKRCLPAIYSNRHRIIAKAWLDLSDSVEAPDVVALATVLQGLEQEESWGGNGYLAELAYIYVANTNVRWHADRIIKRAYRRAVMRQAAATSEAAGNGVTDGELVAMLRALQDLEPPGDIPSETLAEILMAPTQPRAWVVPGLWQESEPAIMAGDGGVGKTWIGLHCAVAIAAGQPVFGSHEAGPRRPVAVLDLERGAEALRERLRRVVAGFGAVEADLRVITKRLVLDDASDASALVAQLRSWGTQWLLVDSLQAAIEGDDCNGQEFQRFARTCLYPLRDIGCGVLMIDHVRKMKGDRNLDQISESLHGTKRKRNAVDCLIGVAKRDDLLAWQPDKSNHHELPTSGKLRLDVTDEHVTVTWAGNLDMASDAVQDAVVGLLEAACRAVPRGELIGKLRQYSTSSVDRAVRSLKDRRVIVAGKSGREASYSMAG